MYLLVVEYHGLFNLNKADIIDVIVQIQGSAAARQPTVSLMEIILQLFKFNWKSKPDRNMAIPLFTRKFQIFQTGLNLSLSRG